MRILWLSWKDHAHPHAGGAEVVKAELCKRLAADGHEVIVLTARYPGSAKQSSFQGYEIIRRGSRMSVYWQAYSYYKKHLQGWADLVIDEVNTVPFFAKYYVKERNILLIHQLAREVWFYQLPFPISLIGYLFEPLYLRLIKGGTVLTISTSSKKDLIRQGFDSKKIHIFSLGITILPATNLKLLNKYNHFTVLSHGSIRPMKRTLDQIRAFEIAKKNIPNLRMKISGDSESTYGKKVLKYIRKSQYADTIEYVGRTTAIKKTELMQKCHLILVTSVKEGWGLIVSEANSQGTPAVVYNVDGLRDSVTNNETGYLVRDSSIRGMADKIVEIVNHPKNYNNIRRNAWSQSKLITFDSSYKDFKKILKL